MVTKSTGVGRGKGGGGKRPGAGRPRKSPTRLFPPCPKKVEEARQRTIKAFEDARASAKHATARTVRELADCYTLLAVETLAEIALAGEKDAARIAAANALLTRAHGAPTRTKADGGSSDEPSSRDAETWDKILAN